MRPRGVATGLLPAELEQCQSMARQRASADTSLTHECDRYLTVRSQSQISDSPVCNAPSCLVDILFVEAR
jgi:hypothetical protein